MTTDDLIGRLAEDLSPVSRWAVSQRLFLGLTSGAIASGALVFAGLGARPDLADAVWTIGFWVKLVYPLALGGIGAWIASRALRPAGETFLRTMTVLLPLIAACIAASVQLIVSDPAEFTHLIFGSTAPTCPWLVTLCSLPPLAGLIWAARGCAPTAIARAGAAIGLAAGGVGGALYSLHCTEDGMPFLGAWYTLGMAIVVVIGCVLGPRFFRW